MPAVNRPVNLRPSEHRSVYRLPIPVIAILAYGGKSQFSDALRSQIDDIAQQEAGKLIITITDVTEDPAFAAQHDVKPGMPVMLAIRNEKVVRRRESDQPGALIGLAKLLARGASDALMETQYRAVIFQPSAADRNHIIQCIEDEDQGTETWHFVPETVPSAADASPEADASPAALPSAEPAPYTPHVPVDAPAPAMPAARRANAGRLVLLAAGCCVLVLAGISFITSLRNLPRRELSGSMLQSATATVQQTPRSVQSVEEASGGGGGAVAAPGQSPLSSPTPAQIQFSACPNFVSQLNIGGQAQVVGLPNNLRTEPLSSAALVAQIQPNQIVTLVDGPRCADEITWWQVNFQNLSGWTGEGRGAERWLAVYTRPLIAVDPTSMPVRNLASLDTLAGLAQGLGGGGGSYCMFRPDNATVIVNASYGQQRSPLQNGAVISLTDLANYDAVSICAFEDIKEAVAIAPDGQSYEPLKSVYEDPTINMRSTEVALPIYALMQPGAWRLRVNGFEITIQIPRFNRPVTFNHYIHREALWVGGFQPNERILIVQNIEPFTSDMYGPGRAFEITADQNGSYFNASLGIPYAVFGFQSGWLEGTRPPDMDMTLDDFEILLRVMVLNEPQPAVTCPGFLPSRLRFGGRAQVIPGLGTNSLRNSPDRDPRGTFMQIPENGVVSVLYGPKCRDGIAFWLVSYDQSMGWTGEGQGSTYWLAPYDGPNTAFVSAPISGAGGSNVSCSGFLPSRLKVGDLAFVSDSEPNNIRAEPGSTTIYGQIPAGGIFEVIDGPICGNNSTILWWKVRYNGITGWTAEGRGNIYWLAPYN